MTPLQIATRLRRARRKGESLRAFAERTGLHFTTLHKLLRGNRRPTAGSLALLERAIPGFSKAVARD
jgi:transcriptional regulator with XRE-family HTH domain